MTFDALPAMSRNSDGSIRSIGDTPKHQEMLEKHTAHVEKQGAQDIRVDQWQTDINGKLVGQNRPDLQYPLNDQQYLVEYDRMSSNRGIGHEIRSHINDLSANITWSQTG